MKRAIAPILLLLSNAPWIIYFEKFDLGWAMIWSNEVRVLSVIFFLFAIAAILAAYKYSTKAYFIFYVAVASTSIVFSASELVVHGIEPSSKGDSADLQLIEFLVEGAWK